MMLVRKLTREMIDNYVAVLVLGDDWSDKNLAAHNLGAGHLWHALVVTGAISDYQKRTGLPRADIALVTNAKTGSVYCQWKYASGKPLPLKEEASRHHMMHQKEIAHGLKSFYEERWEQKLLWPVADETLNVYEYFYHYDDCSPIHAGHNGRVKIFQTCALDIISADKNMAHAFSLAKINWNTTPFSKVVVCRAQPPQAPELTQTAPIQS